MEKHPNDFDITCTHCGEGHYREADTWHGTLSKGHSVCNTCPSELTKARNEYHRVKNNLFTLMRLSKDHLSFDMFNRFEWALTELILATNEISKLAERDGS